MLIDVQNGTLTPEQRAEILKCIDDAIPDDPRAPTDATCILEDHAQHALDILWEVRRGAGLSSNPT